MTRAPSMRPMVHSSWSDGDGRVDDVEDRAAYLADARLGGRGLVGAVDRDVDAAGREPALGLVGEGKDAGDGWLEGGCVGDAAVADKAGVDVARAVIATRFWPASMVALTRSGSKSSMVVPGTGWRSKDCWTIGSMLVLSWHRSYQEINAMAFYSRKRRIVAMDGWR